MEVEEGSSKVEGWKREGQKEKVLIENNWLSSNLSGTSWVLDFVRIEERGHCAIWFHCEVYMNSPSPKPHALAFSWLLPQRKVGLLGWENHCLSRSTITKNVPEPECALQVLRFHAFIVHWATRSHDSKWYSASDKSWVKWALVRGH